MILGNQPKLRSETPCWRGGGITALDHLNLEGRRPWKTPSLILASLSVRQFQPVGPVRARAPLVAAWQHRRRRPYER